MAPNWQAFVLLEDEHTAFANHFEKGILGNLPFHCRTPPSLL